MNRREFSLQLLLILLLAPKKAMSNTPRKKNYLFGSSFEGEYKTIGKKLNGTFYRYSIQDDRFQEIESTLNAHTLEPYNNGKNSLAIEQKGNLVEITDWEMNKNITSIKCNPGHLFAGHATIDQNEFMAYITAFQEESLNSFVYKINLKNYKVEKIFSLGNFYCHDIYLTRENEIYIASSENKTRAALIKMKKDGSFIVNKSNSLKNNYMTHIKFDNNIIYGAGSNIDLGPTSALDVYHEGYLYRFDNKLSAIELPENIAPHSKLLSIEATGSHIWVSIPGKDVVLIFSKELKFTHRLNIKRPTSISVVNNLVYVGSENHFEIFSAKAPFKKIKNSTRAKTAHNIFISHTRIS